VYVNNWQNFLIEDVTILHPYNMGIKIVGNVTDGNFRNVKIDGAGRSGVSGPGIGLGEGVRTSNFQRLTISNCDIENSMDAGIDGEYAKNSTVTITGCTLKNNYYGIQVGATGNVWTVTNNTVYNQTSCAACRWPLMILGTEAGSAYDFNNWYKDGQSPIRVGSAILMFSQWQARGNDIHGVSQPPDATGTPTPTQTAIIPSNTPSASPTPIATMSKPTFTPSPTYTITLTAPRTPTQTPSQTATKTNIPTIPPTSTPVIDPRCDSKYLPEVCTYRLQETTK
jgi:hypothetical protein